MLISDEPEAGMQDLHRVEIPPEVFQQLGKERETSEIDTGSQISNTPGSITFVQGREK